MSDAPTQEAPATESESQEASLGRVTAPPAGSSDAVELSEAAVESSKPFVGKWSELVSTTNWEKGRLISEWRETLRKSGAAVTEYSDEAWARLVGGVTSQHVGRLRRVHERFAKVGKQYPGLYWSHFQAALDWDDAEMWLEGAITNGWSVSQMRGGRWEAVGGPQTPDDTQVIEGQINEDSYQALVEPTGSAPAPEKSESSAPAEEFGAAPSGSESGESASSSDDSDAPFDVPEEATAQAAPRVRPFEEVGSLPDDVKDAFEQFKLVILSHKMTGWEQIGRDDLLGVLEALKVLAVAPSADDE